MIRSNFKIVFGVEVLHSYYESEQCGCLSFHEDEVTHGLMKRFGFIFNFKKNGFEVYADLAKETIDSLLAQITKTTGEAAFCFTINTRDPYFTTFTDLPMQQVPQLTYDTASVNEQKETGTFLLIPGHDDRPAQPGIGSLKVAFSDIIKYAGSDGGVHFTISYSARATQWQYFVINKSAVKLDAPLVTGKNNFSFSGPEKVTIPTGEQALLFTSGTTFIPLSEHPKQKFDLVNQQQGSRSGSAKTIFKGLPNPHPSSIASVSVDGKIQVASPMYVYI
jgi:hypothetical protein